MAYTENELIEEIKRVSKDHCDSEPPKTADMQKHGRISVRTFRNHFDSWENVIKESGFQEYEPRGFYKGYSDEYLISELQSVFRKTEGANLTTRHFNKCSDVSDDTLKERFGSWNEALEKAGLPINEKHDKRNPLNQKEIYALRNEIDKYIKKCKNPFNCKMSDFVNQSDIINIPSPINTHFGSWNELYEDITEQTIEKSRVKYRMDEINRVIDKKETLKVREVEEELDESISFAIRYYGSWSNTLEELGYEANKPITNPGSNWYGLSGENHPAWKGGPSTYQHYYGPSWTPKLKKEIRERDNRMCCACSMSSDEHHLKYGHALEVHHIKPSRDFNIEEEHEIANDPENLATLCVSCHGELERMWTNCNQEEFIKKADNYMDEYDGGVKDSIFDY